MKVLITGVAGFMGSRLASWILQNHSNVTVVGIDDLSCGYRGNIPDAVEFHNLCLGSNDRALQSMFRSSRGSSPGFDVIFHFAAYAAEGLSPFIRGYNYRNNLLATAELINLAIEYPPQRFVFTASMAVYGRGRPPFAETDVCRPIDPYGIAKWACERDLQCAGEHHGLRWTIIRPHNLYGPGQSIWQKYRNVLGIWMERLLIGQPLRVYGTGEQIRAFSYVEDCLAPVWRAATDENTVGETINLGGTQPTSIAAAARLLQEIAGRGDIVHCEPRHEVQEAWCTWDKSVRLLDYEDLTDLRTGLTAMWHWAQDAWQRFPDRRDRHRVAPLEVERGLYSYWRECVDERRTAG